MVNLDSVNELGKLESYPRHPAGGGEVEEDVGLLGDLPLQQPPLRAYLASPQLALVCDGKAADQHWDGHGDYHHATYGTQATKYLPHSCLEKVDLLDLHQMTHLRLQVVAHSG